MSGPVFWFVLGWAWEQGQDWKTLGLGSGPGPGSGPAPGPGSGPRPGTRNGTGTGTGIRVDLYLAFWIAVLSVLTCIILHY